MIFPRTVGATSEAASTSDTAMDSRLTILGESSQKPETSGSQQNLPSTPDHSRSKESAEDEHEEAMASGTDDHGSAENETMDGISDHDDTKNESDDESEHDATENGHVDRIRDREAAQNGSTDDTSDRGPAKRSGPSGLELFEIDKKGRGAAPDIPKKKRKTKKEPEVSCDSYERMNI